jgi:hypothetical protein
MEGVAGAGKSSPGPSPGSNPAQPKQVQDQTNGLDDGRTRAAQKELRYGDWYLEYYAKIGTHQTMIKDKVRMDAYRKAIEFSQHRIKVLT